MSSQKIQLHPNSNLCECDLKDKRRCHQESLLGYHTPFKVTGVSQGKEGKTRDVYSGVELCETDGD